MTQFGIVIVTYQSARVIGDCLRACLALARGSSSIVVVDNASADCTVEEVRRFPEVLLIVNSRNRGFAAACNQGADALDCRYVVLLNPDTVLLDPLEALSEGFLTPGVAAVAGQLVNGDGSFQHGFAIRRLPTAFSLSAEILGFNALWTSNPINRWYRCTGFDSSLAQPVEQPAGALLAVRRDLWDQWGGMDESFHPVWFEDVDLCARVREKGYIVWYTPAVRVNHEGGHSAARIPNDQRALYWYGSLLRYAAKHLRRPALTMVCAAVLAGTPVRLLWSLIWDWKGTPVAAFLKVWRLGWYYLLSGRREAIRPQLNRPVTETALPK